jgi:hypothetical protein
MEYAPKTIVQCLTPAGFEVHGRAKAWTSPRGDELRLVELVAVTPAPSSRASTATPTKATKPEATRTKAKPATKARASVR